MSATAPDDLVKTILDRLVAIEETIPLPFQEGKRTIVAEPLFWIDPMPITPTIYNRLSGATLDDDNTQGRGLFSDRLLFTLRLDSGTLEQKRLNEVETGFNNIVYAILNKFRAHPLLDSPADGSPLAFVAYPGAQWQSLPTGLIGVKTNDAPNAPIHLICDFVLSVTVQTRVGRIR
jgi:hypothetical protein